MSKKTNKDLLKLIYVLKIGKNTNREGMYEFIFSKDPTNINVTGWNWDQTPAFEHKHLTVPDHEHIDHIISLQTKDFELICLHDATDRPYMHGYHLIHALAYEDDGSMEKGNFDFENEYVNDYEDLFENNDNDEMPLLVFHYGTSLRQVEEKFYERSIMLHDNKFVKSSTIEI